MYGLIPAPAYIEAPPMNPPNLLLSPAQRQRQRSQSVVEFSLILPMFLAMVCGLLDYGFMIANSNRLALVVREGANIVSRTSLDPTNALSAMVLAGQPELDFDNNGGLIITFLIKDTNTTAVDGQLACVLTGGLPQIAARGLVFGDTNSLKANSRLLSDTFDYTGHSDKWSLPYRKVPLSTTNLIQGENIYVVEGFITNRFITPIGELLSYGTGNPFRPPPYLYDAAYF
jgi:TadE-like protein